MIALLQRVSQASVTIPPQQIIGQIGKGLLVMIGIEKTDTQATADRLLQRFLNYRVFSDSNDKMNLSLLDIQGDLLFGATIYLACRYPQGKSPKLFPLCLTSNSRTLV